MSVFAQGKINTAALTVPDLSVVLLAPDVQYINGVPTNILGIVGTASWGPVNQPVTVGGYADYVARFGPLKNRTYDMGTPLAIAGQQGANNFRCVRVTDGTDVAASVTALTNCITFTSKFTGSGANADVVSVDNGTQNGTWKVSIIRPGLPGEVFDNLANGLTGNARWVAIAAAINNGTDQRPPSDLIVASAGVGVTAPSVASYALTGGTDGVTTLTDTVLIGANSTTRTGMYALSGVGCSVVMLADATDTTGWPTQIAFADAEMCYIILPGASGQSIATATTNRNTAGADNPRVKVALGDWLQWKDTINGVNRYVAPSAFFAGQLANLAPQHSGLNKPLFGVITSQKCVNGGSYNQAELQTIAAAGLDVITNPVPGGYYWAPRFGRNCSSNPVIHGDNYPRMSAFIAQTLNKGLGMYIGRLQSADVQREAAATIRAFLDTLWRQGMIGNADGTIPYSVRIDPPSAPGTNNPSSRVALGYMQADIKVQFLSVIEYFIANVMGGQSVEIQSQGFVPNL